MAVTWLRSVSLQPITSLFLLLHCGTMNQPFDENSKALERPLEEEVGARQIRNKGTSLISQFFKTFALDIK